MPMENHARIKIDQPFLHKLIEVIPVIEPQNTAVICLLSSLATISTLLVPSSAMVQGVTGT